MKINITKENGDILSFKVSPEGTFPLFPTDVEKFPLLTTETAIEELKSTLKDIADKAIFDKFDCNYKIN